MLKKPITYTDFNNQERTEDFYFNTHAGGTCRDGTHDSGWIRRISREDRQVERRRQDHRHFQGDSLQGVR